MIQNYKEIFVILVVIHILGDFYFQKESSIIEKKDYKSEVIIHNLIYTLIYLFLIKAIFVNFNHLYFLIIIISHFIIDSITFYAQKVSCLDQYKEYWFPINQFSILIILMIISFVFLKSGKMYSYNHITQDFLHTIGIPIQIFLSLLLKILLIHKPINTFIIFIMKNYKPSEKNENNAVKAGRMIGTIERVIMLFFLMIQQYSSVGLVLTAKSIARYNKISEDERFAEYYLLGTLLSTICVLLVSLI